MVWASSPDELAALQTRSLYRARLARQDRWHKRLFERLELRLVPEEEGLVDGDGIIEELELLVPPRAVLDELEILLERPEVQDLQAAFPAVLPGDTSCCPGNRCRSADR